MRNIEERLHRVIEGCKSGDIIGIITFSSDALSLIDSEEAISLDDSNGPELK